MTKIKPTTVDDYIDAAPEHARKHLVALRSILKEVAPTATEALKWGSPVFEETRILFSFSAHKNHINFMPTRTTLDVFRNELSEYAMGKDTIPLPYDKALPESLIRKLATYRRKDVIEHDARWML